MRLKLLFKALNNSSHFPKTARAFLLKKLRSSAISLEKIFGGGSKALNNASV